MSIEPPRRRGECERGRMVTQGRSSADGSRCTLLVVHENDGSWSFHGLGVPGAEVDPKYLDDLRIKAQYLV